MDARYRGARGADLRHRNPSRSYESAGQSVTGKVLRACLDLVLPAPCLACSAPAQPKGIGLCPACRGLLKGAPESCCTGCGRPLPPGPSPDQSSTEILAEGVGGRLCGGCRRRPEPFQGHLWRWVYGPPLDAVVAGLKFGRLDYLGFRLGEELARHLGPRLQGFDAVVPVPLHPWRRWRRGYDQARLIALPLAGALGIPAVDLLRRRRATAPQSRLGRKGRRENLTGAFAVRRPRRVRGLRILLVDDVVTSGATVEAASRCLRAASASAVTVVSVARTPDAQASNGAGF
ncbi:MAG: ComF family protein [Acidobacteriota bacterium]